MPSLSSLVAVCVVCVSAQDRENRNLRRKRRPAPPRPRPLPLDPKTVELKPAIAAAAVSVSPPYVESDADTLATLYNPTPEQIAALEELKYVPPQILISREVGEGELAVDVLSIGSNQRFQYMTSQIETWAAPARYFYGFSESSDYDPNCATTFEDDVTRMAYIDVCRAPNRGTKAFGIGHGKSGGWFCAQRRVGRALGWLQAVYGSPSSKSGGQIMKATIPDILIVVDDDTSVDIAKVEAIMAANGAEGRPYIAAGGVFQLGKYGGFLAAHGGFGTYFNRVAVELLTMPIDCNDEQSKLQNPFVANACEKLAQNKAGEADVYRPGDSIVDVFYKLSSRPYFCMHSDWAMGYMITNYAMTTLEQVEPAGRKKYCGEESVNCHYQTPPLMEEFVARHPQRQLTLSDDDGVHHRLQLVLDPKSVELKSPAAVAVPYVESDSSLVVYNPNPEQEASLPEVQYSASEMELLHSLKRSEAIWNRGNYRGNARKARSNYWGMEGQVAEAMARHHLEADANSAFSPLQVCDRPTRHPLMQYPLANDSCPEFAPDRPILILEGPVARGRMGNNLVEFLHAVQIARDKGWQLGSMSASWAMRLITGMWFETRGDENENTTPESHAERMALLERTFCMKIFHEASELEGWTDVQHMDTGTLFSYHSPAPLADFIPSQLDIIRRLFANYNTGQGVDAFNLPTQNMCMGLNALFPDLNERGSSIYSAIHSRSMEEGNSGVRMLSRASKKSGCHETAALEMQPDYIKAILGPLGMLDHPIVFISDGENPMVLERLLADPDVGPQIRVLDREHTSLGGDITLAIMSNVFIGNPVSSFSNFIGKARLSLGMGHNELWWGVNPKTGKWRSVCGDHCLFDYEIVGCQA